MSKEKKKLEFRYYDIPRGGYVMAKLGDMWIREYGYDTGDMLHFHNYMEIGYCYTGHGRLIIEDTTYKYKDKMFSIIPENIPHTTISDKGNLCKWEFLFINIRDFVVNEMKLEDISTEEILTIINRKGRFMNVGDNKNLNSIIQRIIEECRNQDRYYKDNIKFLLSALVIELLRIHENEGGSIRKQKTNNYIKKSMEYVSEHYSEEVSITDMARVCGLSESHFRRVFEESMNMKPLDYVNMIRIQEACKLIHKGGMSMNDLCYKVGYTTPSTFNRNFKKFTEKTPNEWKRENFDKNLSECSISAQKGWEFENQ